MILILKTKNNNKIISNHLIIIIELNKIRIIIIKLKL